MSGRPPSVLQTDGHFSDRLLRRPKRALSVGFHLEEPLRATPTLCRGFTGKGADVYPLKAVTLQIAVVGDTVTIDDTHVYGSGKETHGTHSVRADGKEHPFEAPALGSGVVVVARWLSSHALDTVVKKDGKEITRVVYEVSPDGQIMTATRSGMFAQMALFERRSR